MVTFRVRENTRTIKGAPGYADFPDYWVYTSPEFNDYYEAIKYAINWEKQGCYPCWVELINTNPDYSWL